MNDIKFTMVCVTDKKFFNFLKALANSIRINSPNIKLIVRMVGFNPSIEEFRKTHYKNTEFIIDSTVFDGCSDSYEYTKDEIGKIQNNDRKSKYSNNIGINTINKILDTDTEFIIYSDVDCIIRKNLSSIKNFLIDSDIALLKHIKRHCDGLYQFGVVPMKNCQNVKFLFNDFEKSIDLYQRYNQPMFNELLIKHNELKIYDLDDSIIGGSIDVWDDASLIWHASGHQKFWDIKFRKEFYKYLSSNSI